MKLNKPLSKSKKLSGFALISTIMIMSLLLILAVAMMNLSIVETKSASAQNAYYEAQLNARLALIEAISELQNAAGSDQRMTMTADIAGKADGTSLTAGAAPENNISHDEQEKGLSMIQNGTRYWTGVWKNREVDPGISIYTKTPTAEHLAWLVSGQNPQPSDSGSGVSATGEPIDETKTTVLVGKNSVGDSNSTNIENFVSAPLVELSYGGKVTGRYAWWVGDEGVKARTNQRADYALDEQAEFKDLVASRANWETIDGFQDYPKPGEDAKFDKIIGDGELELVENSLQGKPLQGIFHSGTPYSVGLATNALSGGLKVDLSYYLENGFPSSANFTGEPLVNENIIPKAIASSLKGPTWKQVEDFSKIGKSAAAGSKELLVQAGGNGSGTVTTIAPTLTDVRALFGAKAEKIEGDKYRIYAATKIAVSIANPYPYPLRWDRALEFELSSDTPAGIQPSCIWNLRQYCKYLPRLAGDPACLNNAIMLIPAGVLEPGEARSYTIDAPVERPWGVARVNINMVPFSKTDPTNFDNAIIQRNNKDYNLASGSLRLDVRESTNSTQMKTELRLSGSSNQLLRRIKSFELDNGFFARTTRYVDKNTAARMTRPFGLQVFTLQISQPGSDYAQYLPNRSFLGVGGSTLRTFADFNVRATHFKAPITSYNPPPYFGKSENSFQDIPFTAPGGDTGPAFTRNLALDPLPWGHSPFGPEKTILFSFPEKMLSLGQLQHADLTADDSGVSIADQPGNAFANSYAPPFVKRHLAMEQRQDFRVIHNSRADPSNHNYYDISYMLNASIWDKYFLSTKQVSDATQSNPNITKLPAYDEAELKTAQKAAANLGIKGAFNVNSTNKQAWIALLSSARHLKHPADGGAKTSGGFFPRSLEQVSASSEIPSGDEDDSWSGYRRLTDEEIEALAEHIVKQVRTRGPFTSLAHFTNRTLIPLQQNASLGRSGPLQSAIDNAELTVTPDRTKTAFENLDLGDDKVTFQHIGKYPRADIEGNDPTYIANRASDPVWAPRSADNNPGAVASILSDRDMLINNSYKNEQGSRSTGIPGWLTQADILQSLGPAITVRSDTFRVRTYGESVDPSTGEVKARAWCEAIVQRRPGYVDPTDSPEKEVDLLSDINKIFGRKFYIIGFRWLNKNEI
ncbi:MAG: hypothetical protein ACJAR1_002646 [Rubritalea sp.]|jgi:hypothetical protein